MNWEITWCMVQKLTINVRIPAKFHCVTLLYSYTTFTSVYCPFISSMRYASKL